MKRVLITLLALLAIAAGAQARQKHDLVILHVNDTHSHLDPEHDGTGGVIERAAYIDSVRRAEGRRNVILLHGGDFEQGSSYFTVLKGEVEIKMVNDLGYDAITLGNHEFDNGIEDLGRRLSLIKCPVVACNYDFSPFEMGKYAKPYTIVRKAGLKVGIIGVLCDLNGLVSQAITDRIPRFNTVEKVNQYAAYLRDVKRCDYIIVLSHAGFPEGHDSDLTDISIVEKSHGLDLVVGGHSHTKMDTAYICKDADGRDVPIVQDWQWGLEVGLFRLVSVL